MQMPGLNGLELQEALHSRGHQTPVILISAYPNEKHRTRALENGAVGYLSKPFDESSLSCNHRGRGGAQHDALLITGGLRAHYCRRHSPFLRSAGGEPDRRQPWNLLRSISPLLAQSGHHATGFRCPLLGVKRTSEECAAMSAFDPKRTFAVRDCKATLPGYLRS
jgi:CheY-like chemotaxis protein